MNKKLQGMIYIQRERERERELQRLKTVCLPDVKLEHLFACRKTKITLIFCLLTGTRSRKRGIDESGAVANYVETEQVRSQKMTALFRFVSSALLLS